MKQFNQFSEQGISLIEVMVALFVLAVGLLGVIALQAESIKLNQQAYASSQAMFLANDAAERLRTNVMVYKNNLVGDAPFAPALSDVIPNAELNEWRQQVADRVPQGTGTVEAVDGAVSQFRITITYNFQVLDNQKINDTDADVEEYEYVLFTQL